MPNYKCMGNKEISLLEKKMLKGGIKKKKKAKMSYLMFWTPGQSSGAFTF